MGPKRQRGRGRGGSVAPAGGLREESEASQYAPGVVPSTQTPYNEAANTEAPLLPTAVQLQEDVSQNVSPNNSPASVPTETPAPTPVRPPVQRLDSLGLPERGGPANGRGVGGRVMAGKFKPRVTTRRALADRVQAQREEDEQRREREIEANVERTIEGNSHGGTVSKGRGHWVGMRGRGRGRGEAMGRAGLDRSSKTRKEASGLFGVAPAAAGKDNPQKEVELSTCANSSALSGKKLTNFASAGRPGSASNSMDIDIKDTSQISNISITRSSRLNTTTMQSNTVAKSDKVKEDLDALPDAHVDKSTGSYSDSQPGEIKIEVSDPVYPEEQTEGSQTLQRIDIEMINLITDDEDDDSSDAVQVSRNKGKGRTLPNRGGLKPVRIKREQHQERVTLVNTEPAAKALANDAGGSGGYQVVVSSDEDESYHLESSRDNKKWSGVWQDDEAETKYDPGASDDAMDIEIIENPATSAKSSRLQQVQAGGDIREGSTSLAEKEKRKRNAWSKQKQPVLQTEEDKAEYMRHLEDLRILAQELSGVQVSSRDDNNAEADDLDGESIAGQPRVKDHEGRLYLFQFPPKLPSLINEIKKEETADAGLDLMEVDTGPSNAAAEVDLTKPDPEEAVFIDTPHGTFQVPREMITEEGFVGKLIVRKSGRVQLDWGETLLELGRGVETDYLTTTLIVDNHGEEMSSSSSTGLVGTATGMGKVMGTFVLSPDFEAMGLM